MDSSTDLIPASFLNMLSNAQDYAIHILIGALIVSALIGFATYKKRKRS